MIPANKDDYSGHFRKISAAYHAEGARERKTPDQGQTKKTIYES